MGLIHEAAKDGKLEEVRRLVEEDATHLHTRFHGWTALQHASNAGQAEVIQWLLGNGAKVDDRLAGEFSALYIACYRGWRVVVDVLMEHDADPFITCTSSGWNALSLASFSGHVVVVDRLVRDKRVRMRIDDCDGDGNTALHWACRRGYNEVARVLLWAGADPTIARRNGHTPLDSVRCRNDHHGIKLLEVSE